MRSHKRSFIHIAVQTQTEKESYGETHSSVQGALTLQYCITSISFSTFWLALSSRESSPSSPLTVIFPLLAINARAPTIPTSGRATSSRAWTKPCRGCASGRRAVSPSLPSWPMERVDSVSWFYWFYFIHFFSFHLGNYAHHFCEWALVETSSISLIDISQLQCVNTRPGYKRVVTRMAMTKL